MSTHFTQDASRSLGGPDWLVERRSEAAERVGTQSWPTPAEEIWRYSRIHELDLERFSPVETVTAGAGAPVSTVEVDDGVSAVLATRNGRVTAVATDPALESKGVRVGSLVDHVDDPAVRDALGRASSGSSDAFTTLHDAFLADVAVIVVPDGVVVEHPVVVDHAVGGDGRASFPHTLVLAGESSAVTVLDRFGPVTTVGAPDDLHLCDAVVELLVGANADVRYLSVQQQGTRTWHLGLQRAHVAADGRLRSSAVALGGDYARLRSESLLEGRGATSDLLAVYFGDGDQMLDFRTLQDHAAEHTHSDLLFKGAVEGHATSVYSGLVHLRPAARKAEAFQTNRNLVLTEGARAESIPNLVIEANDVRCSHASTVGPIDDDQRYYLETRGVPPHEAERLIILGFFDDVFTRLPATWITAGLRAAVVEKLERGWRP